MTPPHEGCAAAAALRCERCLEVPMDGDRPSLLERAAGRGEVPEPALLPNLRIAVSGVLG